MECHTLLSRILIVSPSMECHISRQAFWVYTWFTEHGSFYCFPQPALYRLRFRTIHHFATHFHCCSRLVIDDNGRGCLSALILSTEWCMSERGPWTRLHLNNQLVWRPDGCHHYCLRSLACTYYIRSALWVWPCTGVEWENKRCILFHWNVMWDNLDTCRYKIY